MNTIWADFARMIFHVEVQVEEEAPVLPAGGGRAPRSELSYSGGSEADQLSGIYGAATSAAGVMDPGPQEAAAPVVPQRRVDEHDQLGRNAPCWCGSGKKYKKCHGATVS